jgi:hypothetical protein
MPYYKYNLPVYFDGFSTTVTVDTSEQMPDARLALWSLYDLNSNEIQGAVSIENAQTLLLTVSPAPPEGNYQLVGIA